MKEDGWREGEIMMHIRSRTAMSYMSVFMSVHQCTYTDFAMAKAPPKRGREGGRERGREREGEREEVRKYWREGG